MQGDLQEKQAVRPPAMVTMGVAVMLCVPSLYLKTVINKAWLAGSKLTIQELFICARGP